MKAFPIVIDRETQLAHGMESAINEQGMDLRDYFAAKALQGMLAADYPLDIQDTTILSYEFADEMMKARAK